jgi:hypothetical protein
MCNRHGSRAIQRTTVCRERLCARHSRHVTRLGFSGARTTGFLRESVQAVAQLEGAAKALAVFNEDDDRSTSDDRRLQFWALRRLDHVTQLQYPVRIFPLRIRGGKISE